MKKKKTKKRTIYIKGLPFKFEKEHGRWWVEGKESKFTTIHSGGKTLKEAKENVRKCLRISSREKIFKNAKVMEVHEVKIRR